MGRTLTILLAGGKGQRLEPLTADRAKPAVPFGAHRIIDFPLSNCVNSGLFELMVLTQYKSLSLVRHLDRGWKPLFQRDLGAFLDVVPPQQRVTDEWYRGTADAVYHNIWSIEQTGSDNVLVLAGDHIYAMDYREMIRSHESNRADVTVGAYAVPVREAARQFGVIQVDRSQRVVGFQEKPAVPAPIPGDESFTLASMGIYVFRTRFLLDVLCSSIGPQDGGHDFGHHILPAVHRSARVTAFPFRAPGGLPTYWRDVGTIDAYFAAVQDLLRADSPIRLDERSWPIRTFQPQFAPALLLSDELAHDEAVRNSLVCAGSVVESASVDRSVLGHGSRVSPGAMLADSVMLGEATIGRDARLNRVIVDKRADIPAGMQIGFDADLDRRRGFTVSAGGVTVVPRGFAPSSSAGSDEESHQGPRRRELAHAAVR